MKKTRPLSSPDPERLTTRQLLAEHERVFGPLTAQAKRRLQRAAEVSRVERRWDGMDGLAA
jgi:hypothetical protein